MIETVFIEKHKKLPESEDYAFLRKKGLDHIRQLAHEIWTDYNIHDPGITLLELLGYAITDLGYRTSYEVKDILAEKTFGGDPDIRNFFSARRILTCNPVTLRDFRKVIIDVPGVGNSWMQLASESEQQIYIDCPDSRLTLKSHDTFEPIRLQGLYNIILEFEADRDLGDLNIYHFSREIGEGDAAFSVEVIFPAWDAFFAENILPAQIAAIRPGALKSIEQSQEYEGSVHIDLVDDGGVIILEYMVLSHGLKTLDNKIDIENELQRDDDGSLATLYTEKLKKALEIAGRVYRSLHRQRNLCEDFFRFKAIAVEEIGICADIEVTAEADLESVLAEIYYKARQFLAPPVRFHTIQELMDRGKTADKIFEGPKLDYGFIDDDELAASELREIIHVSDIIQIIMDVEGVVAVKNILLTNFYKGAAQTQGEEWCLTIAPGRATRLSIDRSSIVFYKGLIPYPRIDQSKMQAELKDLLAQDRHNRLRKEEYDLDIPRGEHRAIADYYSIQHDLPLVYGVGPEGLPPSATSLRKAQAKQLKAYMLFYDQLLANYFSQLAHVKDLFSMNPAIKKTYFSQPLYEIPTVAKPDVPNVPNLVKDFVKEKDLANDPDVDFDDFATYKDKWQEFIDGLQGDFVSKMNEREPLIENETVYEDRKNRFLDHLMARFCEQFTDYVLLLYHLDRKKAPAELIADKFAFLNDYPEISYQRGKAFDDKDEKEVWYSDNVSGLQKRVARLLGMKSYRRRFLVDCIEDGFEVYLEKDEDDVDEYRFRLKDQEGKILLSSSTRYATREQANREMQMVVRFGTEKVNYTPETTTDNRFTFNLIDDGGNVIARRIDFFDTEEERDREIDAVVAFLTSSEDCEGFHLIEHILLRPKTENDTLFNVCVNEDCNTCSGFIDPYSFRVTAVVPSWPERFENMDFRKFFEATIRAEAPAHVHVKICWVSREQMAAFEEKYLPWLVENARAQPNPDHLFRLRNDMIKAIESLRSVYPETTLHDCEEGDEENPVLLNQSVLRSMKQE